MLHASPLPEPEAFLTVGQAADFLGVSPWTVRHWDRAGKLKHQRHPETGSRIYRHEDLELMLDANGAGDASDRLSRTPINWTEIGDREHFVQFYETDAYLTSAVSGFVGASLEASDGAIIIATAPHRESIERRLKARGIDVTAETNRGFYVALDAAETLSKFMVDGSPDPQRFAEVVGGMVRQLTSGGRRLRAFGEMVALLWASGNRAGAISLEQLWNELAATYSFSRCFCTIR